MEEEEGPIMGVTLMEEDALMGLGVGMAIDTLAVTTMVDRFLVEQLFRFQSTTVQTIEEFLYFVMIIICNTAGVIVSMGVVMTMVCVIIDQ